MEGNDSTLEDTLSFLPDEVANFIRTSEDSKRLRLLGYRVIREIVSRLEQVPQPLALALRSLEKNSRQSEWSQEALELLTNLSQYVKSQGWADDPELCYKPQDFIFALMADAILWCSQPDFRLGTAVCLYNVRVALDSEEAILRGWEHPDYAQAIESVVSETFG